MAAHLQSALLFAALTANAQHSDPSLRVQAALTTTPTVAAVLPHLRPCDPLAAALLATGTRSSSTFAQLVRALDRVPDLVVYISTNAQLDHRGSIVFVSRAGAVTYLLIRVSARQRDCDRVAVLAHEMTHAVEIAQSDPPVTGDSELKRLYACIGIDSAGGRLESSAAVRAEQAVRHELGG